MKKPLINICVCTYKRKRLLEVCLRSLARATYPGEASVMLSVFDNDAGMSAKDVVESQSGDFSIPLEYFCETRRGIPCIRNRAIEETQNFGADYLVFIDDDEWVEKDWLVRLFAFSEKNLGKVIVSGQVVSDLPEETPAHIRGLFNKRQRKTGSRLSSCATNNVMVPTAFLKETGLSFDENHPLAGGTDTMFFCNAVEQGGVILKCAEAIVHETIPQHRTSLKWLARRKYRAGITVAWRKKHNGHSSFGIVFSGAGQIPVDLGKCIFYTIAGKKLKRNAFFLNISRSAGIISGLFGHKVDSYRNLDAEKK